MEQDDIICSGCGEVENKCTCYPLLTPIEKEMISSDNKTLDMSFEDDYSTEVKVLLKAQLDKDNDRFLAWLEKHGSQVQVDLFKEETGL